MDMSTTTNNDGEESLVFLYDMKGSKKPEYWNFIKLIAPNNTSRTWKNADCIGAYCTKCQEQINYSQSNPSSVRRHMQSKHKNELLSNDEQQQQNNQRSRKKQRVETLHYDDNNTLKMQLLSALWTASSFNPFEATEDSYLQQMITLASKSNGIILPSKSQNKQNVVSISNWLTNKVKDQIRNEMQYYSTTTSISQTTSLMSLTLSYLTMDFQLKEFTLEVLPVSTAADLIRTLCLCKWGLRQEYLCQSLRDSDSSYNNNDWDTFTNETSNNINHLFRILIDPFLVEITEEGIEADIRKAVQKFRKAAEFLKECTNSNELRIKSLHQVKRVMLKVDSNSRCWNSTYWMLRSMLQLEEVLTEFQVYYQSDQGKNNFKNFETKFPEFLSQNDWALIRGTCKLISLFDQAFKLIKTTHRTPFVSTLPYLRALKKHLANDKMFRSTTDKFHVKFKSRYGETEFYTTVLKKLDCCRNKMLHEFLVHFRKMDCKLFWVSLFDPRYARGSYLSEFEKREARRRMREELEALVLPSDVVNDDVSDSEFEEVDMGQEREDDDDDIIVGNDVLSRKKQEEQVRISEELDQYLNNATTTDVIKCPLMWWKENRLKFPRVAIGARKWLSVCATSSASERLSSLTALLDTSDLTDDAISSQVFIRNNLESVNPSVSQLQHVLD